MDCAGLGLCRVEECRNATEAWPGDFVTAIGTLQTSQGCLGYGLLRPEPRRLLQPGAIVQKRVGASGQLPQHARWDFACG